MSRTRIGIVAAVAVAAVLVILGVVAVSSRPAKPEPPHFISMTESAQAMQQAGSMMQTHGQSMLDDGRRTGDQELMAHGERWLRQGQDLALRGQWMAADPLDPPFLISSPGELAAQESLGELHQQVHAMVHDPRGARSVDLDALRWNGLAMQAEGRNMASEGQLLFQEVEAMVTRHSLSGQPAAEMRQSIVTMQQAGGHLEQNGQEMIAYADRLRRSLGYR